MIFIMIMMVDVGKARPRWSSEDKYQKADKRFFFFFLQAFVGKLAVGDDAQLAFIAGWVITIALSRKFQTRVRALCLRVERIWAKLLKDCGEQL